MKALRNHVFGGRMVKWKGRVASIAPALASVSVVALMSSGALADTVVGTHTTPPGLVTTDEAITITTLGLVSDYSDATVELISVDVTPGTDYTSTITNNGRLLASESITTGGGNITATGIYVATGMSGNIINNGDILLDVATGTGTNASAVGIWVNGELSGQITNSATGVIDAAATAVSSVASAQPLPVGSLPP